MNFKPPVEISSEDFAAILRHNRELCSMIDPPKRPEPVSERDRLIAEYIAEHGVTRSVSFGADQPAIDALREIGVTVFSSRCIDPRRPWIINQKRSTTADLWRLANSARRSLHKPAIRRGK